MEKYGLLSVGADGSIKTVEFESETVELRSFQELVGGYIEVVRCATLGAVFDGVRLVCDEDGKGKGKPLNMLASALYGNPHDVIVGDVVLCGTIEVPEPDICALPLDVCKRLSDSLLRVRKLVKKQLGNGVF